MRLTIYAKPKKKQAFVKQISPTEYTVSVKEPAQDGRANAAIIKALANYFNLPQAEISFVSGQTSHIKILAVPDHLQNFELLPQQKGLF